jgi:hypothetical protein
MSFFLTLVSDREMLRAIIRFSTRLTSAFLGAIFTSLSEILKVPVNVLILALFLITGPFLALYFAAKVGIAFYPNPLWPILVPSVTLGMTIVVSVALPLLAWSKISDEVFKVIFLIGKAIFVAPFLGAYKGWTESLGATVAGIDVAYRLHVNNEVVSYQEIWDALNHRFFPAQAPDVDALGVPQEPAEPIRPINENFEDLQLTPQELNNLKKSYRKNPPLAQDEIFQLESNEDEVIKSKLEKYKQLLKLSIEACMLLYERPERDDTIVLIKQYNDPPKSNHWVVAPGTTRLFGKASLIEWVNKNPIEPNSRDPLFRDPAGNIDPQENPGYYHKIDNTYYEARYRYHNYYLDEYRAHYTVSVEQDPEEGKGTKMVRAELGLSQEMAQLTAELRASMACNMELISGYGSDDEDAVYAPSYH